MMVHGFNPSTQEAEARDTFLSLDGRWGLFAASPITRTRSHTAGPCKCKCQPSVDRTFGEGLGETLEILQKEKPGFAGSKVYTEGTDGGL